jgi:hypothetical protein
MNSLSMKLETDGLESRTVSIEQSNPSRLGLLGIKTFLTADR